MKQESLFKSNPPPALPLPAMISKEALHTEDFLEMVLSATYLGTQEEIDSHH